MWHRIVSVMMIVSAVAVFSLAGCGGGGGNVPNNKVTIAKAGAAQNVVAGTPVTLDGSKSTGAGGSLINFQWTITSKPAGSVATINNASAVNPTLTADLPGQYLVKLTVTDAKSATSEDTVLITVNADGTNAAPVANAGTVQHVATGTLVTLDGSGSSDANGDLLTYSWSFTSKPEGSSAFLSDPTAARPTFVTDVAGAYVLSLVVNDGKVSSAAVAVTVNASAANVAPVANAGTTQNVATGTVVTLDGTGSSDANGDLLTYSWFFTSLPVGSTAYLSNPTAAKPTFIPDQAGIYLINLTVNDGKVTSFPVAVIVNASVVNAAPVANAGPAQNVVTGTAVTLDGTASTDANGDSVTYSWAFTSKPAASNATLSNPTSTWPTFLADVAGVYVVKLVVNDGKADSAAATVTVTASVPEPDDPNYVKTGMLKGTWSFSYSIGGAQFSNSYSLYSMDPTPNSSGTYYINGIGLEGEGAVNGAYNTSGYWSVLDPGSIIDRFFYFKTDGTNVLQGGCYYQVLHPTETWSACYPLSGTKSAVSLTARRALKAADVYKREVSEAEAVKANPTEFSEPTDMARSQYKELRKGIK